MRGLKWSRVLKLRWIIKSHPSWVRGLKCFKRKKSINRHGVASLADAWIKMEHSQPVDNQSIWSSDILYARKLVRTESNTRIPGEKQWNRYQFYAISLSHPLRMCGLKQIIYFFLLMRRTVTSSVDAWLCYTLPKIFEVQQDFLLQKGPLLHYCLSYSSWVCGLKL